MNRILLTIYLLFSFGFSETIPDENSVMIDLKSQYNKINNDLPEDLVSLVDILNSSVLYKTMSKSELDVPSEGVLARLIEITDKLIEDGEVSVTLKLQSKFYPEGSLSSERDILLQRQKIIDVLVPIILDKMLDSQQMLDSIQIYDTIPYFTITLNKNNFWYLLESKGIVDIQLNSISEPSLLQSTSVVEATNAWTSVVTGLGQVVAVLDTGIKKDHQFLTGKVISEACYSNTGISSSSRSLCPNGVGSSISSGSGVNCNPSFNSCNHGTHVAGIVAGNGSSFSGVAKDAKLISIQVFTNNSGSIVAYNSDVTKGLERVYALRNSYSIAAANMSLGGGKYTSYCDSDSRKAIIDNLLSSGITTVIASGNESYTNAVASPGCIQTAVTVGSTSDGGYGALDSVPSYSNSAYMVDLLAPGSLINSSIASSATSYSGYHGTSMAAPHVAGAFALLKSIKNDMTVAEGLNALITTGASVTDIKNGIVKKRIKIHAAISGLGRGTITVNTNIGQWSLDNLTWKNSGESVSDVFLGKHKIYFKSVTHTDSSKVWLTPSFTVDITHDGHNASLNALYVEVDKLNLNQDNNGDGKSDILIRNASDGSFYIYLMDGATSISGGGAIKNGAGVVVKPSNASWKNAGIGDFNGDGKSDILIRNASDGSFYIYLMDGATSISGGGAIKNGAGVVVKPSNASWKIIN